MFNPGPCRTCRGTDQLRNAIALLGILVLLLVPTPSLADEILVRIVDEEGRPVPGAVLHLVEDAPEKEPALVFGPLERRGNVTRIPLSGSSHGRRVTVFAIDPRIIELMPAGLRRFGQKTVALSGPKTQVQIVLDLIKIVDLPLPQDITISAGDKQYEAHVQVLTPETLTKKPHQIRLLLTRLNDTKTRKPLSEVSAYGHGGSLLQVGQAAYATIEVQGLKAATESVTNIKFWSGEVDHVKFRSEEEEAREVDDPVGEENLLSPLSFSDSVLTGAYGSCRTELSGAIVSCAIDSRGKTGVVEIVFSLIWIDAYPKLFFEMFGAALDETGQAPGGATLRVPMIVQSKNPSLSVTARTIQDIVRVGQVAGFEILIENDGFVDLPGIETVLTLTSEGGSPPLRMREIHLNYQNKKSENCLRRLSDKGSWICKLDTLQAQDQSGSGSVKVLAITEPVYSEALSRIVLDIDVMASIRIAEKIYNIAEKRQLRVFVAR